MRALNRFCTRLLNFVTKSRGDERLREEMESHITSQTEENMRAGMTAQEAVRQARLKFGGIETIREAYHMEEGIPLVENLLRDSKFALRQFLRNPGFTATAIATLALGIGATTAIFSLLDEALLEPLPVRSPHQLVLLEATPYKVWNGRTSIHGGDPEAYFSYPMYKELRDQNTVFDGVIAMVHTEAGAVWHGHSELLNAELVSGNYFDLLGVKPAIGQLFTQADDEVQDGNPVVVLSFDYWKAHLAEDPNVVGQTLDINGHPFQIVGVAAPPFQSAIWGTPEDIFVPMTMKPEVKPGANDLDRHNSRWLNILGRLKPGESREQAEAGLAPLWHSLRTAEIPLMGDSSKTFVDRFVTNSRLHVLDGSKGFSYSRGSYRDPLLAMMAMAVLLLLMSTVNVASLVLVRAAGRAREISMRFALGARRERVVRQLLVEGLILGVLGGSVGLALSPPATRFLVGLTTVGQDEPAFSPHLNVQVLVLTLVVSIAASLIFAVAPALQIWKRELVNHLKLRSSGSTGAQFGFQRVIVGSQIVFTFLLLILAGLFVRTLANLRNVNLGFATDHLLTFGLDPALVGYSSYSMTPLRLRVLQTLQALPGVKSVGATNDPEIERNGDHTGFSVEGYTPKPGEDLNAEVGEITPDYFATLKVPIVAGRGLSNEDDLKHPRVALVNQAFADRFFGSPQAAIGHMMSDSVGSDVKYNIQIVGVVRNYIHQEMRSSVQIGMYWPVAQDPGAGWMQYYVRTRGAPDGAMRTVRQAIHDIDPKLVLDDLSTMPEKIDENIHDETTVAFLAASFGILATLMAAIGIYGILAYATAQRTREIGVRMALGAGRRQVTALVVSDVIKLAGTSIVAAIPLALVATRGVQSLLFGISKLSVGVFIPVALTVLLVSLLAAALPAWRAARVEPMEALRSE